MSRLLHQQGDAVTIIQVPQAMPSSESPNPVDQPKSLPLPFKHYPLHLSFAGEEVSWRFRPCGLDRCPSCLTESVFKPRPVHRENGCTCRFNPHPDAT